MSIAGGSGGDRPRGDGQDSERNRKDTPARRYDDRAGGRGASGTRGPRTGDGRAGRPAREWNNREWNNRDRTDRGRNDRTDRSSGDRHRDDRGGESRAGADRVGAGWSDRPRTDRPR